ncbi:head-tail connector protein [Acuticoccus sediminis]|uniref:head-tail connector protein n=1 Tax=Acuticoccus sediminis TaxID=2184697 RepID=UPI001CFD4E88|nr:head-tail connector protein [Acuticoccus sediminis]
MTALVTSEQVADRARIDPAHTSADLEYIADEATDIVIGYLKKPDHGWTIETVPPRIRTAIIMVAKALYDDEETVLSDAVKSLLHRDRDPALA